MVQGQGTRAVVQGQEASRGTRGTKLDPQPVWSSALLCPPQQWRSRSLNPDAISSLETRTSDLIQRLVFSEEPVKGKPELGCCKGNGSFRSEPLQQGKKDLSIV